MENFEVFYLREFRGVVGLIYTLFGSLAAEEIAQEAFLEAYKQWKQVGPLEKPGAWVRKVATRLAGRSKLRQALEAKALARKLSNPDPGGDFTELSAERAEFWQVVRGLRRREAQCLVLHYQAGYSVAEIASILEISAGTAKSYLHHGRSNLAKELGLEAGHGEQP